jgi:hypothetical protein
MHKLGMQTGAPSIDVVVQLKHFFRNDLSVSCGDRGQQGFEGLSDLGFHGT